MSTPTRPLGAFLASNPVNCSYALVSYHLPYDSSSPDAGVTYTMQFGEPYDEGPAASALA